MPTALAEWTTEHPDAPGFYWWMRHGEAPAVVDLRVYGSTWNWMCIGALYGDGAGSTAFGSLWWPVRLEPPPVG